MTQRIDVDEVPLPLPSGDPTALVAVAIGSLTAASGIHLGVVGEHWAEHPLLGGFFVGLAGVEGLLAAGLVRRPLHRGIQLAALLVSAATVLLWVASRTTGVPSPAEHW